LSEQVGAGRNVDVELPSGDGELLDVRGLSVRYRVDRGTVSAVDDVSFSLGRGMVLGLLGESGCGKTTLVKALIRLLPGNARITSGVVRFLGRDLLDVGDEILRKLRWEEISLVSQSAMNSLDPVYRVGDQIVEAITCHRRVGRKAAWRRAGDLFALVGLDKQRLRDYPHQFSGGMKQRAVIAMALALEPDLIIADEPTTALDVMVQAQILKVINELQLSRSGSLIIVTHDISVIAQTCHVVGVMYGGKLVEFAPTLDAFERPSHPYTMGLKNAFPTLTGRKQSLVSIPGTPPDLVEPPKGCRFRLRCPFEVEECMTEPEVSEQGAGCVACHRFREAEELRRLAAREETWREAAVVAG